ncbi:MAG: 4-hydroxybenzoate octaprenyltransferase [Oceanobacter sp.]
MATSDSPQPTGSVWHDWVLLTRFDKPVGSYLLLWPTLWALWAAAEGVPDWKNLLIFIAGVFVMRSAGCVINDYADREIDRHVARTRDRPLTQGRITEKAALTGFAILCLMAFGLVLMTNGFTVVLSLGALALAALYPFMKRHTHLPQVFLGAAFSWAIPMAFAAEREEVTIACWLLYIANLCWTVAYDTIYAMVDRDDDIKIGVKSTAVLFADLDLAMIGALFAATSISLLMAATQLESGMAVYAAILTGALYHVWQLWKIKGRERAHCFTAFRASHWYGVIILLGLMADYALPQIQ